MLFAYYDPPYPGLAAKYYGDEPTFAGEVDHGSLIASAKASGYAFPGSGNVARMWAELSGVKLDASPTARAALGDASPEPRGDA